MATLFAIVFMAGGIFAIGHTWFLLVPIAALIGLSVLIARAICRWRKMDLPGDVPVMIMLVLFALVIGVGLTADLVL